MTQDEALQEARRRWGDNAKAYQIRPTSQCRVGSLNTKPITYLTEHGIGDSWEAAFADADRRAGLEDKKGAK